MQKKENTEMVIGLIDISFLINNSKLN